MIFKTDAGYVDLMYELDSYIDSMSQDELCTKHGRLLQAAFSALKNLR